MSIKDMVLSTAYRHISIRALALHAQRIGVAAWRRGLKHQWLYLNQLNTIADVRRVTKFYVEQHNTVMPHAAFEAQTPDEMYYGASSEVVEELKVKREEARRCRLEENRRAACGMCPRTASAVGRAA